MRKIIAAQVCVDGVMQASEEPSENPTKGFKLMLYFDQELGEEIDRLFSEKFDLRRGKAHILGVEPNRLA